MTKDRSKMQLPIHIKDTNILNLEGKKISIKGAKKRDLKKISFEMAKSNCSFQKSNSPCIKPVGNRTE